MWWSQPDAHEVIVSESIRFTSGPEDRSRVFPSDSPENACDISEILKYPLVTFVVPGPVKGNSLLVRLSRTDELRCLPVFYTVDVFYVSKAIIKTRVQA